MRRALVVLALVAALLGALPSLLSTRALRPVLEKLVARHIGVPLRIEDGSVRWFGALELHGLTLASPAGFGAEPLATVRSAHADLGFARLLARRAPARVALAGVTLDVVQAGGGDTNLGRALGNDAGGRARRWLQSGAEFTLADAAVRLRDLATGTITMLHPLTLSARGDDYGLAHVRLACDIDALPGRGALELEYTRAGTQARTLSMHADNVVLETLQPLATALLPGSRVAGRAHGRAVLHSATDELRIAWDGRVDGFIMAGTPWSRAELRDTAIVFAGELEADLAQHSAHFEHFRIATSCFGIDAHGALAADGTSYRGDLRAHLNLDFERTARRLAPALAWLPPGCAATGDLVAEVELDAEGRFRTQVSAEALAIVLPGGRSAQFGELRVAGHVDAAPDLARLGVAHLECSALAGEITGEAHLRRTRDQPVEVDLDLRYRGDLAHLERHCAGLFPGLPLMLQGDAELHVTGTAGPRAARFVAELRGADQGARFERVRDGDTDFFLFRGTQLRAHVACGWERGSDVLRGLTGELSVDAAQAWLRSDPMSAFMLRARMADGVFTLTEARMNGYDGGAVSAAASLAFTAAEPVLELRASLRGARVEHSLPALFAPALPVFAARPGPFAVNTTCRADAELVVTAIGRTTSEFLRRMDGRLDVTLGAGEVTGSALLDALRGSHAGATPLSSMRAQAVIAQGTMDSAVAIHLADGGALALTGSARATGAIQYTIPARDLLDHAALSDLDLAAIPADLFGISGDVRAPTVRVPDATFHRLVREGNVPAAVQHARRP